MDLQEGARQLGIELSAQQLASFARLQAELLDWNQRMNLTTITNPAEIVVKHFLDSLSCLVALPHIDGRTIDAWLQTAPAAVDIGAGAGFPGLPIKIVWPDLRLTLLDATGKKTRFMTHAVGTLGLTGVTVVQARAEEFGRGLGRQAFDLAFARAVSRFPTLLEYSLPMVKVGGWLIAQKGRDPQEELAGSQAALKALGRQAAQLLSRGRTRLGCRTGVGGGAKGRANPFGLPAATGDSGASAPYLTIGPRIDCTLTISIGPFSEKGPICYNSNTTAAGAPRWLPTSRKSIGPCSPATIQWPRWWMCPLTTWVTLGCCRTSSPMVKLPK